MIEQPSRILSADAKPGLTGTAACAVICAALLLPKGNYRPAADNAEPQTAALAAEHSLRFDAVLNESGTPAFFSVCHRFTATPDAARPYLIDYTACPVKHTQVSDREHISLTLPESVDTVLVEVWPMTRVERAQYVITSPGALQRDGLQLP